MQMRLLSASRLTLIAGILLLSSCSQPGAPTADHPSAPVQNTPVLTASVQDQQSALNMVMSQKDVKAWLSFYARRTSSPYQSPVIKVDHREGNELIVHVYEQLQNGQQITFGWYRVNMGTNVLQKFQQSSSVSSR